MTIKELEVKIKQLQKEAMDKEEQLYRMAKDLHPDFNDMDPDSPGYDEYIAGITKVDEMLDKADDLEIELQKKKFEESHQSLAQKLRPLPRLTPGWVVLRTIEEYDDEPYSSCVRVMTSVAAITQTEEAARSFVSDHKLQDEVAGNFSVRYHVMRAGDDFEDYYGHAE